MGLIRIQIHLNRVDRFEWVQMHGNVARPTCQWRCLPCLTSPAEPCPTRRRRDRVLPPARPPPPLCGSLLDPPPPHPPGAPYQTPPPPLLPHHIVLKASSAVVACSFPPPPLLPFPRYEHLLTPLTSCLKPTAGAAPVPSGLKPPPPRPLPNQ
jgi:hypothetical protein